MSSRTESVVAVVVSNRPDSFRQFLSRWYVDGTAPWDSLVLLSDSANKLISDDEARKFNGVENLAWPELLKFLDMTVLPEYMTRGDSARKSLAFAYAVAEQNADVVLVLDDDCYPDPDASDRSYIVDQHLNALFRTPRWISSIPGRHVRGLPYDMAQDVIPVMLNMGYWKNVPDDDAVHALAKRDGFTTSDTSIPECFRQSRVMPSTQYWPMCGMNLAFRRELLPLMYFPRQGIDTPYRRFDDIWCGTILQAACRHLGYAITAGTPAVWHDRASNSFNNLIHEAPGILANQAFWHVVDSINFAGARTPYQALLRASGGFQSSRLGSLRSEQAVLAAYLPRLSSWLAGWAELMKRLGYN